MPSRVVLITGAAGGLGSVMAAALLADGHAVAAVDRSPEALARLAASLGRETALADRGGACRSRRPAPGGRGSGCAFRPARGRRQQCRHRHERDPPRRRNEPSRHRRDECGDLGPLLRHQRAGAAPGDAGGAAAPGRREWGRIVNNTTSYRTMLRVLPYGATKSALESMSAVWALELEGTGVGVNVLVPGGPTDTPFINDASGWPRDQMLRPAIMGPPISWLMSEAQRRQRQTLHGAALGRVIPPDKQRKSAGAT